MFQKTTESASEYADLTQLSTLELLQGMNTQDQTVPQAIAAALPAIERFVDVVHEKMAAGGRLFYIGSGTSGRLGVVDASECPPTYGVPQGWVVGIIAGGDSAIRRAVEGAEDDSEQGWRDLEAHQVSSADVVLGISASGATPYVLGAIRMARAQGIVTGGLTCNAGAPLATLAEFPIEVVVGPEFVTGSTRMKAGTAQKLVLNMISTAVMVKLGRVRGNKMVDMQLSNKKLVERGTQMIVSESGVSPEKAREMLLQHGSVRAALLALGIS